LAECLPPLGWRFGKNQIAKSLHRSEIELAILEGAPCELTGLCQPAALYRSKRFQYAGDHCLTAMQLQLRDVLAGLAVRRGEPQRERLVDRLTARRIVHARERHFAWLRHATDQSFK